MSQTSPRFDNSYARLPERFFARLPPTAVAEPGLIRVNTELAAELGIDPAWLSSTEGVQAMAGNIIPDGAEPIATVYAGHQFGSWNPRLGDGRALLLGEVIARDGQRFDIQLKGSGRTPYSRGGDGRAPLGPVLREYIVSETMAAFGIPTTRSLAAVTTGETVYRDAALPGAVLARVAHSHIRIGTVQYFYSIKDHEALKLLLDHVIGRHYPAVAGDAAPYLALLRSIIERQASLVAQWQMLGFIHGVMNTDNMLLSGETIDYGPCAFMDAFDPGAVYSSIDHGGRYAYRNQPAIAHWNLTCLAQAMLPVLHENEPTAIAFAQEALAEFPGHFERAHQAELNRKLGFAQDTERVRELGADLFQLMATEQTDFTLTFRRLTELASAQESHSIKHLFEFPDAFNPWLERWRSLVAEDALDAAQRSAMMTGVNPVLIPRNHLVEEVISAAVQNADFAPFHRWVDALKNPYFFTPGPDPGLEHYARPPRPEEIVRATFCGT